MNYHLSLKSYGGSRLSNPPSIYYLSIYYRLCSARILYYLECGLILREREMFRLNDRITVLRSCTRSENGYVHLYICA